jgi:hypothetical protein
MGFEPQTVNQPLVNVHKRTTKVNFAVAIGVAIFFAVGIALMVWAFQRDDQTDMPKPLPAQAPK